MKNRGLGKIGIWIVLSLIAGFWIGLTTDKKPEVINVHQLPPKPDKGKAMYYDFYTKSWKYVYSWDKIPDNTIIRESLTEDELEEYLIKHVPGYESQTYWGREADEEADNDDDMDDEETWGN